MSDKDLQDAGLLVYQLMPILLPLLCVVTFFLGYGFHIIKEEWDYYQFTKKNNGTDEGLE